MAGLLTQMDHSEWKGGDVKENYRFSIISLVCPPEPFFKCQPAQAISTWFILRINLKAPSGCCFFLVSSSSGQSHIFDPLFCFCPHLWWDSWSTTPPNSPSFSYLIFQRSVGSCAASQFCFSVFIHPPPSLQSPFILLFSSSSPPPPSFSLSCPGSGADCSSIRRSRTWPFSERHLITDTAQQWTALKLNYFVLIYSEMVCALTDVWEYLTKYYELDFTWIVAWNPSLSVLYLPVLTM